MGHLMNDKRVSVIIPTYNRPDSLRCVLASLEQQTMAADAFEVVVVDDGSDQGGQLVVAEGYPFAVHCLRQPGQGATQARNLGSRHSRGEVLVFIDDDVTVAPETLAALYHCCLDQPYTLALGLLRAPNGQADPTHAYYTPDHLNGPATDCDPNVHFLACKAGLLAVCRGDFFRLGMFQDPTGGWPNWDDVDFGYRASQAGYCLRLVAEAEAIHHDAAVTDLSSASRRWYQASRAAVRLFERYPDLRQQMPMFEDKLPLILAEDRPALVLRKVARRAASSRPFLWGLEQTAGLLGRFRSSPRLLQPLQRWIIGGYIYRGFQAGLREAGRP
jgi:glycosyltransferase involved in cell wall biosynthesis